MTQKERQLQKKKKNQEYFAALLSGRITFSSL